MIRERSHYQITNYFFHLIVFWFLISFLPVYAIEPSARFERISTENGLSDNFINSIIQDRDGFLWVATSNGLNRYDGLKFKKFKHDPYNQYSILSNEVNALYRDSKDTLWVGTASGLNHYDPYTESFKRISFTGSDILNYVSVNNIVEDNLGYIWIGTMENGLYRINIENGRLENFQNQDEEPNSLRSNFIFKLYKSNQGTIWVSTAKGLSRYDSKNERFVHYHNKSSDPHSIFKGPVGAIFEDNSGAIWIGGLALSKYDFKTERFEDFTLPVISDDGRGGNYILTLEQDGDGKIWIGTIDGLIVFDPKVQQFNHFKHVLKDPHSLINSYINYLFVDTQGILWIGTSKGLSKYHISLQALNHIREDSSKHDELRYYSVWSFLQDSENILWVGTSSGVERFGDNGSKRINANLSEFENLVRYRIMSMYEDSDKRIWIATWGGGLYIYNMNDKGLERVSLPSRSAKSRSQIYITKIIESRFGVIWIGTARGLIKYDLKNGGYQYLKHGLIGLDNPDKYVVNTLFEDRQGILWVGTNKGLYQYDYKFKILRRYVHDISDKRSLSSNDIRYVTEDRNGNLWIATTAGLNKFEPKTESFSHCQKYPCPTGIVIHAILEDKSGKLWLSSDSGIVRFDTITGEYKHFDINDGLQDNKFHTGSAYLGVNGELFFGGPNGFNRFTPETIKENTYIPPVVLTELSLFNQNTLIRKDKPMSNSSDHPQKSELNKQFSLDKSISYSKELELSHMESMFSFQFAALNYLNPRKNQYAYKMEGYDKEWITTDSHNPSATYTNLDSGNYVFRVIASNNDGLWNEEGASINIQISPPWWKSNLAYFLYFLIFLFSVVLFITYRTRALRLQSKALERKVTERTREIEQLLSLKDKDFANISHEFRTPLTLILGPATEMLRSEKEDVNIKRLEMIQRNSNRLLSMVEQLLNIESFRVKSITEQRIQSFSASIINSVDAFYDLAIANNLGIEIKKLENVNFTFTKDAFDKVMLNLLSNAVKYTPSGGKITVFSERTADNELMIEVKDTGIGIPKEQQNSVFDRYTRVLDNRNEQVIGSGLGLALVKEIVELHQGRIELESICDIGSTFRVYLPIIDEVHDEQLETIDNLTDSKLISDEKTNLSKQLSITSANRVRNEKRELVKHNNQTKCEIEKDNGQTVVLLVEDDPDMRQYLLDCIGSQYQVFIAKDGEQGFNIATAEVPDIIISDIMMPVMDGIEMVHQLKSQGVTSHIPIIFLTAKGDHKSRMIGLQEHANDYLTKPFNVDELLLRVSNLLLIQSQLRKKFIKQVEDLKFKNKQLASKPVSIKSEISHSDVAQNGDLKPELDKKLSTEHQFIQQLDKFINDNYQQVDLNIENLAKVVFVSERQLRRKFKALLDMTPAEYLRNFRLEKAALFLSQGKKAGDVSFLVGYSSHSSFSQSFKVKYGVSPSDYVSHYK